MDPGKDLRNVEYLILVILHIPKKCGYSKNRFYNGIMLLMLIKTHYWAILAANQRKGVPQKLRALELGTLTLYSWPLLLRRQNSKFSGTWGQILDLLLLSSSRVNKKRTEGSASHSTELHPLTLGAKAYC